MSSDRVLLLELDRQQGEQQQCTNQLEDGLCLEWLEETHDACPLCGIPVVWKRSPTWRAMYDTPSMVKKRILSTPKDKLGKEFLVFASQGLDRPITHFSKPHDLTRWRRIVELVPESQIRAEVNRCSCTTTAGYGLIQHVLNSLDKIIREDKIEQPQDPFEGWEVESV